MLPAQSFKALFYNVPSPGAATAIVTNMQSSLMYAYDAKTAPGPLPTLLLYKSFATR